MRWVMVLAGIVLAGCGAERLGEAAQYRREAPAPIRVVMPRDATYISQQFLVSRATTDKHEGIDLWGARSTPVLAAAPGVVVASWKGPLYGNRVRIDHGVDASGRRVFSRYFHLEARTVKVGQRVVRGEVVGRMGATGLLAGGAVHLHFEVWRGADEAALAPIDPHLVWADGPGRVTCFDPARDFGPGFVTTYPTACGG
jgi:murein DD-endopeptidase MepM/ murein hydrolase activator NlpD